MSERIDSSGALAGLLALGLLGGCVVAWRRAARARGQAPERPDAAPAWQARWLDFGLFAAVLFLAFYAAQTVAAGFLADGRGEPTPWRMVGAVIALQIPVLLAVVGLRGLHPETFFGRFNAGGARGGPAAREAAWAFLRYLPLVWAAAFFWSGLLQWLLRSGVLEDLPGQAIVRVFERGGDPAAIGILAFFAVAVAPIVEELLFRGCLYRFFKGKGGAFAGALASGALFALIHANLLTFLPLFLLGLLLARVYEETGHLAAPIAFHGLFNGLTLLLLSLGANAQPAGA